MEGNRWVKEYGAKYVPENPAEPYGQMTDGIRLKNALKSYEKYLATTVGASDSKETYALLSEHTHPNSICFHRYTEIVRPDEIRFVKPSSDASILGEERCLIHFLLFLDELLRLGKEVNVLAQLRPTIEEICRLAS